MITFLLQVVVISFSGVIVPGPITAATLAAGTRSRHAGSRVAIGHGVVEFPLMLLVMAGAGTVLALKPVTTGIGLVGGAVLVLMGAASFRSLGKPGGGTNRPGQNPLRAGIILTGSNPYFLLWWATVGLELTSRALQIGTLALALLALVHWLCDLVWLEALSFTSFKGTKLLGNRLQGVVLAVCSVALVLLGLFFIVDALRRL